MDLTDVNAKTFVKVDEERMRIVVTHEVLHPVSQKECNMIFSMDIEHAGKLVELLSECIRRIHELHAAQLPYKAYEPKSGRTHA